MNKIDTSRRRFLVTGSLALGGGLATMAGFDEAFAKNGANNGTARQFNTLNDQLLAIGASPATMAVRQQLARLVSDPALPALAISTQQAGGANLTGFQTALLEAVLVMTYDPAALAATVAGVPLTKAQDKTMNRIRGTLQENPAIQRLIRAGATLKGQRSVLQNDISQVITSSGQSAPSIAVTGNPALAAVVNDSTVLLNSSAFGTIKGATVPLMQTPGFLPYLRTQSPLTVVGFMPPSERIALELAHQVDPPLGQLIVAILTLLAAIAGLVAAILAAVGAAAAALVVGIVAGVLAVLAALGGVGLVYCPDFDGDGDCD